MIISIRSPIFSFTISNAFSKKVISIEGGDALFSCLVKNTYENNNIEYLNANIISENSSINGSWATPTKINVTISNIFDLFNDFRNNKSKEIDQCQYFLCTGLSDDYDQDLNYYKDLLERHINKKMICTNPDLIVDKGNKRELFETNKIKLDVLKSEKIIGLN